MIQPVVTTTSIEMANKKSGLMAHRRGTLPGRRSFVSPSSGTCPDRRSRTWTRRRKTEPSPDEGVAAAEVRERVRKRRTGTLCRSRRDPRPTAADCRARVLAAAQRCSASARAGMAALGRRQLRAGLARSLALHPPHTDDARSGRTCWQGCFAKRLSLHHLGCLIRLMTSSDGLTSTSTRSHWISKKRR